MSAAIQEEAWDCLPCIFKAYALYAGAAWFLTLGTCCLIVDSRRS